jgi:hypothetical protein
MALFPPTTNASYRGSPAAPWWLVFAGALEIVPGCIHYFLPDGGAGVIAGVDLTHNRETILGVFAWMGAMQIPFGLAMVLVGLRYRPLTPLFLGLSLVERALMALSGWVLRPSLTGHHPPEHYASPAAVALLAVFLTLSLRERGA